MAGVYLACASSFQHHLGILASGVNIKCKVRTVHSLESLLPGENKCWDSGRGLRLLKCLQHKYKFVSQHSVSEADE